MGRSSNYCGAGLRPALHRLKPVPLILAAVLCSGALFAQTTPPKITTPKDALGFNIGDDYMVANYTQLEAYWKKLASESDRMKLVNMGKTEEGRDEWMAVIDGGLAIFERTPHILQRFHKGKRIQVTYLDNATGGVRPMDGRVRLCPYYFVAGDEALLSGVLATIAPADKRLIHGMSDAVMTTAQVSDTGY